MEKIQLYLILRKLRVQKRFQRQVETAKEVRLEEWTYGIEILFAALAILWILTHW